MPISVRCAGCNSKLGVPDTAAGKGVACPKCGKMLLVPKAADDFEVVEDDFDVVEDDFEVVDDAPVKTKSKGKKAVVADDDDDERPKRRREEDDDEEDRPRKKGKKKPPPKKSNLPLILGGLGVLAVLGIIAGVVLMGKGKKGSGAAGAGDSWVSFSAPDGSYSVSFPSTPSPIDTSALAQMTGENAEEAKSADDAMKLLGITISHFITTDGTRRYVTSSAKFPQAPPNEAAVEEMVVKQSREEAKKKGGTILGEETVSVSGKNVTLFRVKSKNGKFMVSASLVKGDHAYSVTIVDDTEFNLSDEKAKKFFDSFAANASSSPPPGKEGGPEVPGRRGRR